MPHVPKVAVPPRSSRTATTESRAASAASSVALGVRAQRVPRLGRLQPAADALEEPDAELRLEPAHLLGQRRLRQVELLGGGRERAVAEGGEEVLELL